MTPPESNRLDRQAEVNLTADGSLNASVKEPSIGQSSVMERAMFRHLSRPEYTKLIEGWITNATRAGTIPADQYQPVRNFFERIRAAEQAPFALAKNKGALPATEGLWFDLVLIN